MWFDILNINFILVRTYRIIVFVVHYSYTLEYSYVQYEYSSTHTLYLGAHVTVKHECNSQKTPSVLPPLLIGVDQKRFDYCFANKILIFFLYLYVSISIILY